MPITPVQLPDGTIVNIDHAENAKQNAILQRARQYYNELLEETDPEALDTSTFGRGFSRGVDLVQLGYSSALEGIGKVTGIEGLEQFGAASAKAQEEQLAEQEPSATRRQDVEDIRSGARFVAETAAEQLPTLATTLAGVGAGAAIGSAVPVIGTAIGGIVGGLAVNIPFFYGLNREAQKDSVEQGIKTEVSEGAAILYALPQAALDVIADRFLIGSGIGTGIFSETALRTGNILTRGVKGASAGVISEVPTEIGQQILERIQANQDITSDEAISAYIDVAVAAGILGGGARATSSVVKGDIREQDFRTDPGYEESFIEEAEKAEADLTELETQRLEREAEIEAAEQLADEEQAGQQLEAEESPVQKVIDKGKARTRETEAVTMPRMPIGLSRAKPRYASFNIKFANDVDKALYIVQDPKKSASHQKYLQFLRKVYEGKSDAEIRALGTEIKNRIGAKARSNSVDSDGYIVLDPVAFTNPNQKMQEPAPVTTAGIDPAASEAELVSAIEEKVTSRKDESAGEAEVSDNDGGNKNTLIKRLQSGMPLNEDFNFERPWARWDKFVYHIQDRFNFLAQLEGEISRRLESAGLPKLKSLQSAYQGEERTHDMIATGVKTFETKEQIPLAHKITKLSKKFPALSLAALDEFIVLRHAPERNKRVLLITRQQKKPNPSGSGEITYLDSSGKETKQELTNNFVKKRMKSEYDMTWDDERDVWTGGNDKARIFQSVASDIDKIAQKTMDLRVEKGLVTEGDANNIRNTFKYYVPLKGHKDALEDMGEVYRGGSYQGGKSLTVIGDPKRLRRGRETEAVSPMGAIFQDRLNTIQKGIINKQFSEPLMKLAASNPNSSIWDLITDETPGYSTILLSQYHYVGSDPDLIGTFVDKKGYVNLSNKKDYIRQTKTRAETPAMLDHNLGELFGAKIDGEQVYLDVKDERLRKALLNIGPSKQNALVNSLATVNRFLSVINTALNPEFLGTNFIKDIQAAVWNVIGEQTMPGGKAKGQKLVRAIRKNTIASVGIFYKGLSGSQKVDPRTGETSSRLTPKQQKDFDDFIQSGAKAGWFQERPPQKLFDNFSDLQKMSTGTFEGNFKLRRKAIVDLVEWTNSAIENGARFSVFVASRDAYIESETAIAKKTTKGKSLSFQEKKAIEQEAIARASTLAKNLTINFNRRGQQGVLINSMYLFFNASVQGTANFARGFVGPNFNPFSPEASRFKQAIGAGIVGLAGILSYLNESVSDEDENGRSFYANIPDWQKETSFIVMKKAIFPDAPGDEYFKFPLPYGYNVLHTFGVAAEELHSGSRDLGAAASMLTGSLLSSFAPISFGFGATGIVMAPVPTPFRPVAELAINENFFGAPIYKEPGQFGAKLPSSQLSYASTPEGYKLVSEFLNFLGGGNESEPGSLLGISTDISPDALQHLGEFALGAAGATGMRGIKSFENWSNNQEVKVRDIPFLRRLQGEVGGFRSQQDFFKRRDEILRKQNQYEILQNRASSTGSYDESAKYLKDNRLYIAVMSPVLKQFDNRLRAENTRLNKLAADQNNNPSAAIAYQEGAKEIEDAKDRIYDRFNLIFEEKLEGFK